MYVLIFSSGATAYFTDFQKNMNWYNYRGLFGEVNRLSGAVCLWRIKFNQ